MGSYKLSEVRHVKTVFGNSVRRLRARNLDKDPIASDKGGTAEVEQGGAAELWKFECLVGRS